MELHIVSEANRCLNCKKPMCQQGCPIHTPIPQVIQLFKAGKPTEAGQILFENKSTLLAVRGWMSITRIPNMENSRLCPYARYVLKNRS